MNLSSSPRCLAALISVGTLGAFGAHQSHAEDVRHEFLVLENLEAGAGSGEAKFRFGRSISFDQGRLLVGDPLGLKNGREWGRSVLFSPDADPGVIHGEDAGDGDKASCMTNGGDGTCHRFGSAVALAGFRAAVSAPWREDPLSPGERPDLGRVSIFHVDRPDVIEHVLEPSESGATWGFGHALVFRDDVLLVGIAGFEDGVALRGGVEVFDVDGFTSLGMLPREKGSGAAGVFGKAIAADGGSDRIIVGSVPEPGSPDVGAAHIYDVTSGDKARPGRLELLASLFPPDLSDPLEAYDGFGSAVAIDGIHAAVSAPGRQGGGAVYLYRQDANGDWSWIDVIEPPGLKGMSVVDFGRCLELEDGILYVGAPGTGFTTGWLNTGGVFGIPVESSDCTRIYRASDESLEMLGVDIEIEGGHLYASAPGPNNGGLGRVLGFSVLGADVDRNGIVDVTDLLAVINSWGTCSGSCPGDTNCDGRVDVTDLLEVIAQWRGVSAS